MDFIDLKPIDLQHTPMGTRIKRPKRHEWQLDWDKMAQLIRDNQDVIAVVQAGLAEDWLNTHGTMWDDKWGYYRYPNDYREFDDTVFWGASTWATPTILVTFHNELAKSFACYKIGADPDFHYLGRPR